MKQFTDRFKLLMDDNFLEQKIRTDPTPLLNLGSLPVEVACLRFGNILKEVFVPNSQILHLLRKYISVCLEYVQTFYPDEETYIRNCYCRDLTKSEPWLLMGLTGLGGVGKTKLLKALTRLFQDNDEVVSIPGLPNYPIKAIWMMTMRTGGNLAQLLQPFLSSGGGSQQIKNLDTLLALAAKRAYTSGTMLEVIDEYQFITSSLAAHAKAAKTLMQLALVGPPLLYCVNYSMINKLERRPQQERQRILTNVDFLYPDPLHSKTSQMSLEGQLRVAPEAFSSDRAINFQRDGEAIHRYSFGISRLKAQLMVLAYRHSRESSNGIVCSSDIEWAYKSAAFTPQRHDVELLMKQVIEKKSARDDLWCNMAEQQEEKVIEATKAIEEYKSRVYQELSKASMNKEDRDSYEFINEQNRSQNAPKAPVVPIRRAKATKETLLDGNKIYQEKMKKI